MSRLEAPTFRGACGVSGLACGHCPQVVLDFETEECLAQPDAWLLVLGFCLAVNRVLSLQVSGVLYKFSPRSQQA